MLYIEGQVKTEIIVTIVNMTYRDIVTRTYYDSMMTYCSDGENDDGEVAMLMEITTQIGNKSLIKIMAQSS